MLNPVVLKKIANYLGTIKERLVEGMTGRLSKHSGNVPISLTA